MTRTRSRKTRRVRRTGALAIAPIMLVLIAASACMHEPGLEASRSTESIAPEPDAQFIQVIIDSDGGIWIGDRVVDPQNTSARIERLRSENPDWPVVISADPSSPTRVLVAVIDAAQTSGVRNISIGAVE